MKRRIALATDSLEPSGMGEHMLILGQALAGEFDVTLACLGEDPSRPLLRRAARSGLRIKDIHVGRPDLFRDWLRAAAIDLVHVHAGIGWEGHELVRAAKAEGKPVVRTEHLPYLLTSVVQQAEYRAMVATVDRRIAVSHVVAASHAGRGGGAIDVVRNGITHRAARGKPADIRAALGLGKDDRLLLTVARFTAQKRHDLLVEAAPAVLSACSRARFVLVGTGVERDAIEARISRHGLSSYFVLLGARDDVPELLESADLFVSASDFEGLSLALLEAMAAGVPLVATGTDSTRETLGESHPFLAPPGDARALAETIVAALTDPKGAAASAVTAGARYAETFTAERMARETAAIYASLPGAAFVRGAHG